MLTSTSFVFVSVSVVWVHFFFIEEYICSSIKGISLLYPLRVIVRDYIYVHTHTHTHTHTYIFLFRFFSLVDYYKILHIIPCAAQYIFFWLYIIHSNVYKEKAMAPHSSTLAWKIPWMEEPGRLRSMGSLRVGHYWGISLSLFTFMHRRRKWQPTPVFLPGESQGQGSLVGCHLWGRTESDMTEAT